jgi:surface protein
LQNKNRIRNLFAYAISGFLPLIIILYIYSMYENGINIFFNATLFNQPIGSWDVSNVTYMSQMFYNATSFNQDIGSWDVSGVTNMDGMFYYTISFNQDLSSWCVSLIPSLPSNFDTGATSWVLLRPVWGTCPP